MAPAISKPCTPRGGFPPATRAPRPLETAISPEGENHCECFLHPSKIAVLPQLVGSPLSINALREGLQLAHKTVAGWIRVLERLFAVFRLPPLLGPRIRAVKKEQKHYHFDWSVVPTEAQRFENLVASHLLKWVDFQQDTQGRELELRYFRDTDGREVDFVVVEGGVPILLVEAKWADAPPDSNLRYLRLRYPSADAWQISAVGKRDFVTQEGVRVAPALALLRSLC